MPFIRYFIPAGSDGSISFAKLKPHLPGFLLARHGNHGLFSFRGAGFCPAVRIPYLKCIGLDPILCRQGTFLEMPFYQSDIWIPVGTGERNLIF